MSRSQANSASNVSLNNDSTYINTINQDQPATEYKHPPTIMDRIKARLSRFSFMIISFNYKISTMFLLAIFFTSLYYKERKFNFTILPYDSIYSVNMPNQIDDSHIEDDKQVLREEEKNLFDIYIFITFSILGYIILSIIIHLLVIYFSTNFKNRLIYSHILVHASSNISFCVILIVLTAFIRLQDFNFMIPNFFNIKIFIIDVLDLSIVAGVLYGIANCVEKILRTSFSRSVFVYRILNFLRAEYFIALLEKAYIKIRSNGDFSLTKHGFKNDFYLEAFEHIKGYKIKGNDESKETKDFRKTFFQTEDDFISDNIAERMFLTFKGYQSGVFFKFRESVLRLSKGVEENTISRRLKMITHFWSRNIQDYCFFKILFDDEEKFTSLFSHLGIDPKIKFDTEGAKIFKKFLENHNAEKKNIKKSIKQINKAIKWLKYSMIAIITILLSFYLFLSIQENKTVTLSLFSAIFGTGYIFQSSVKNAIDSIIFLFFIHPYDVGDRVFVNLEGVFCNLVVNELTIFSTEFIKWDGTRIYVPNSIISTKVVYNVKRSGSMAEKICLEVSKNTTNEKLDAMKNKIKEYLEKNSNMFSGKFFFGVDSIEDSNKINVSVLVFTRKNWQFYEEFLQNKKEFMIKLNEIIDELDIKYTPLVQRIRLYEEQGNTVENNNQDGNDNAGENRIANVEENANGERNLNPSSVGNSEIPLSGGENQDSGPNNENPQSASENQNASGMEDINVNQDNNQEVGDEDFIYNDENQKNTKRN